MGQSFILNTLFSFFIRRSFRIFKWWFGTLYLRIDFDWMQAYLKLARSNWLVRRNLRISFISTRSKIQANSLHFNEYFLASRASFLLKSLSLEAYHPENLRKGQLLSKSILLKLQLKVIYLWCNFLRCISANVGKFKSFI